MVASTPYRHPPLISRMNIFLIRLLMFSKYKLIRLSQDFKRFSDRSLQISNGPKVITMRRLKTLSKPSRSRNLYETER